MKLMDLDVEQLGIPVRDLLLVFVPVIISRWLPLIYFVPVWPDRSRSTAVW